jgi:transaldolase
LIWLDTLSRELIDDGRFAELVDEWHVTGTTSNPTIFKRAICGSRRYDQQIVDALADGIGSPRDLFIELALEDVRRAAWLLRGVYEGSRGEDGIASLQCTPDVADDSDSTVRQALGLWTRLDAPNVMIKVPATDAGIEAIEALTAAGVSVNVTLLFSLDRYEQAIEAYLRGLERRAALRQPLVRIRSVASFFVSRIDAKLDLLLDAQSPLRGEGGIASARRAYVAFRERFSTARWQRLAAQGASPQRPLWASTGTKDPAYRDVVYLEQLALRGSILTVPEVTLTAFADHGDTRLGRPLARDSERVLAAFGQHQLDRTAAELEREGLEAFRADYVGLLECIEDRVRALRSDSKLGAAA